MHCARLRKRIYIHACVLFNSVHLCTQVAGVWPTTTCCAPGPTDCMFEVLSPSSVPARDHRVQEARHACTVFSFELYVPGCKGNDPLASPTACPERQRPIGIADGMSRAATTHRVHPTRMAGISHVYTHVLFFVFFFLFIHFFSLMHHRCMQYRYAIICN